MSGSIKIESIQILTFHSRCTFSRLNAQKARESANFHRCIEASISRCPSDSHRFSSIPARGLQRLTHARLLLSIAQGEGRLLKLEWRVEFASENACARGGLASTSLSVAVLKVALKRFADARSEKVTPMRLVIYAPAAIYEAFRALSRAPIAGQHAE